MKLIITAVLVGVVAFSAGRFSAPKVYPTQDHHMPDGVWFGIKGATNRPATAHVIARLGGTNTIAPVDFAGGVGVWHDVQIDIDAMNYISMVQVTPRPDRVPVAKDAASPWGDWKFQQ